MSGSCKPNVDGLKKEGKIKLISGQSNGKLIKQCGLFNGDTPNEWDTENVFYWYNSKDYLEIKINNKCNIWRSGTSSWSSYTGQLKILRLENGEYNDITESIEQKVSPLTNGQWEKTILNLRKGRYKFVLKDNKYRIDSEWYIESISTNKFLLEQNNKLYTIKSEFYDLSKSQYNPVTDIDINNITDADLRKYGFDDIGDVLTEITTGYEKFKPIEKLKSINDGKFNIITKELEN